MRCHASPSRPIPEEKSQMKSQFSRRAMLATFSGIACAGYFKGLLRDAFAQQAKGPQRLIVLSTPHGCGENDAMRTDGPSIDHAVAKQLGTKPFYFKPLGYAGGATAVSYDDAGEQIPYEYDFRDTYKAWFGSFMAPSDDPTAKARSSADLAVVTYLQAD